MKMKRLPSGQSLIETTILTASFSLGILGLWSICNERIINYIDLVLAIIASPVP